MLTKKQEKTSEEKYDEIRAFIKTCKISDEYVELCETKAAVIIMVITDFYTTDKLLKISLEKSREITLIAIAAVLKTFS